MTPPWSGRGTDVSGQRLSVKISKSGVSKCMRKEPLGQVFGLCTGALDIHFGNSYSNYSHSMQIRGHLLLSTTHWVRMD